MAHHSSVEPVEETEARYEEIANAIVDVATEDGFLFEKERGERTALVLASIADAESHFTKSVFSCAIGGDKDKLGNYQAWGLWQTHSAKERTCANGVRSQARMGLTHVKNSINHCRGYAPSDFLGIYTDGHCSRGNKRSAWRWNRAVAYETKHPFPTSFDMPASISARDLL